VEGLHDDPIVNLGNAWGIRRRTFGGIRIAARFLTAPVKVAVSPETVTVM
jgi:hypothetical protein